MSGVRSQPQFSKHGQPSIMLSARVNPALRERLKGWAVESGESTQRIVEAALTAYLDARGAP